MMNDAGRDHRSGPASYKLLLPILLRLLLLSQQQLHLLPLALPQLLLPLLLLLLPLLFLLLLLQLPPVLLQ